MASWLGNGSVCGIVRDTGFGPGPEPFRLLFSPSAYALASPGSVNLNGPTRFQYAVSGITGVKAQASFSYDSDDALEATHIPSGITAPMGAVLMIAPASAFTAGTTPTPSQIRAECTEIVAGTGVGASPSTRTTIGDLDLEFALSEHAWTPNEKWWALVAPVYFVAPLPVTTATAQPLGTLNVSGRAVSLWTNRTPLAPVITTPSVATFPLPGSNGLLAISSRDPDRITMFTDDIYPYAFGDVAGVHVQFAPVPTESDPTPAWEDLTIVSSIGTPLPKGWFIEDADLSNDGAEDFWQSGRLALHYGNYTADPGTGILPSGDWQVRVRVFDYGHPVPIGTVSDPDSPRPPLNDVSGDYDPATYPEVNTSPWSEPALISVSAQVPPPIPLSPINGTALIEGADVTLIWKYRNTYFPPFPQESRSVQIRKVGDPAWTDLVTDDPSASASYEVVGFPFVSGNQYEWRVRVTDTSDLFTDTSEWSAVARFWMVPPPDSGAVIPTPGETIDGATLGCGTHRIEVYRRGGKKRVGEITGISSLEWNRVRDDISTSKIVVSGWDIDCGELLADLQTWAYEIVIFRDNGFSVDRVWEGPITLLTYEIDKVTIHAKDIMAYLYRRIIRQAVNDFGSSPTAGRSVVARAINIIQNAFAPDDPNVLGYLQELSQPDDPAQYRSTPAYSRTAFEEVDDMAANAGLDYTAVGRAILVWGTKHRIGTLPEFKDQDLGASPIVSEYGMSASNVYVVSDGNGVYGQADRLNEDDEDPTYGLVEMLSSTWASESVEETGTYTEEGLATIRESFAKSAERSIADRYPPPMVVRVPDNTRLNPDVVLSIQHLVPGVVVPLRSTGTLRSVVATQKLDALKVVEVAGEESITITLSPFSRDDIDAGGEVTEE